MVRAERLLWGLAGAFLGVYVIVQDLNIPLIIQPQLFGSLCLISWAQVCTSLLKIRSASCRRPGLPLQSTAPCAREVLVRIEYSYFIFSQCQYYGNKRPLSTCIIMLVTLLMVLGGFEAGMVFAVRVRYSELSMVVSWQVLTKLSILWVPVASHHSVLES